MKTGPIKSVSPQDSHERLRLLVENVQDYAIFTLDPNGNVESWNPGAERMKGYTADEVIGQHFSKFYPPEDIAAGKPGSELKIALSEGRVEGEGWRVRKDGTRFWALVVVTAMRNRAGELVGFAKVIRDLTERKATEEQLRASEEQFRMLVEGVEEYAIYMIDPNGTVATWNSGAEKLKGYRASEIIGKNFACFYTSDDVAAGRPARNLAMAAKTGHLRDQGLRVRKDGSTFQAEVVLTALRDSQGRLRGYSKVTRDITEQLRTRELEAAKLASDRANKAKDDFLAALSHELRTPLTPALAAASFLVENADKLPEEFRAEVDTIRRNVQLQARLIDDLLDLTRVTRGKLELHFARVDGHALIRDALEVVAADIEAKNLKVVSGFRAKNHHIWADPVRIEQVFWNLINNAVKFTPAGGQIDVVTSNTPDGDLVFEVIDNGIGIEATLLATLFHPFEQGERQITRQFGGLGLGLAISKQLVDLHAGTIGVESKGRTHGATFRVQLATVSDSAEQNDAAEPVRRKAVRTLRILLVEDHPDTRRTLTRLLKHFGHDVTAAEDRQSARDIVEAQQFDVVLSDIGLPDGSGYDVIEHAKRNQALKGVALTGYGSDADIRRGKEAGFDFHLTKPVDFHELRAVLDQVGD